MSKSLPFSRREFLKGSAVGVGGLVLGAGGLLAGAAPAGAATGARCPFVTQARQ